MDTPTEFRKHAADCETMAKVSSDHETKAAWKRMAERWLICARLAEDQDLFLRRRVGHLHSWAAATGRTNRPEAIGIFIRTFRGGALLRGFREVSVRPAGSAAGYRLPPAWPGPSFLACDRAGISDKTCLKLAFSAAAYTTNVEKTVKF
jgi:hypothetical protein